MSRVRSNDPAELFAAATDGDRPALARLLSLVEQGGDPARAVGRLAFPLGGDAATIGITGAPGAGKSTLTSALIGLVRNDGHRVGVLAIDPSSPFTGGAILGDRVRMGDHTLDHDVFIRSMATRGHLGGLALSTPEAVRLLDALGFPWILIETVGVGQVEVEVAGATDTRVVVLNPGWGDAVQANKAGLMEIADIFVVNKADRPGVSDTVRDIEQMLELSCESGWRPPIVTTVGTTGEGVGELWSAIGDHRAHLVASGELGLRRRRRLDDELRRIIAERLLERARLLATGGAYVEVRSAIERREIDPWSAADRLLA